MLLTEAIIQDSTDRYLACGIARKSMSKALVDGPRDITPVQKRGLYSELLAETTSPVIAARTLERIIAGNDLVGVSYLAIGRGPLGRLGGCICSMVAEGLWVTGPAFSSPPAC